MEYGQLLNEIKMRSDEEVKVIARQYGIDLSISEIRALRPLWMKFRFIGYLQVFRRLSSTKSAMRWRQKKEISSENTWMLPMKKPVCMLVPLQTGSFVLLSTPRC